MDIEERVLLLVSKERGIKLAELNLSDRLNVDLGMDGDDAVEFFEQFQMEFDVDCSDLRSRWSDYFGPEGVAVPPAFLVVSAVIGLLIAIFFPGLRNFSGFCFFLVICFTLLFIWAQLRTLRERKDPISPQIAIAQLVQAANTKRLIL